MPPSFDIIGFNDNHFEGAPTSLVAGKLELSTSKLGITDVCLARLTFLIVFFTFFTSTYFLHAIFLRNILNINIQNFMNKYVSHVGDVY